MNKLHSSAIKLKESKMKIQKEDPASVFGKMYSAGLLYSAILIYSLMNPSAIFIVA